MKGWRLVVAVAAVTTSIAMPRLAVAEDPYPESAGWGVLAVLVNVGYMPVKTVYATIGGVTGGFAYACTGGSYDTASNIWEASLGGTYVLTPSMIRGETPIAFAGDSAADAASSETSSETTTVDQPTQRSHRGEEGLPPS